MKTLSIESLKEEVENLKEIYCDGSCIRNGAEDSPGGWNFIVIDHDTVIDSVSGSEVPNKKLPNTNIRLELMAVIKALEHFEEPEDLMIHSDSAYVVNGVNQGWYKRWFRTGKNSLGKRPANMDLWKRLVAQLKRHTSVKMIHVKGHSGHRWQELSDTFARQAATSI